MCHKIPPSCLAVPLIHAAAAIVSSRGSGEAESHPRNCPASIAELRSYYPSGEVFLIEYR